MKAQNNSSALVRLLVLAMACSLSVPANAHIVGGEAGGFLSGFEHPISGMDHILAMVSVGLWERSSGRRQYGCCRLHSQSSWRSADSWG